MPGITGATGSLSTGIPGMTGSLNSLTPAVTGITTISIYLIAPIGIFIAVAGIGWAMRLTELWTSTAITLGLSIVAALILMSGTGIPLVSERYISDLVQWIAYLVQPFCVLAAILILVWTEKFRRSLTYTVTKENIAIQGGVWKHQEHLIPHHQIARVVLEQDLFGRIFNYGTVIPQSISRWGAETSFRGVGASGQKDNVGAMIGYAKGREEASRYPLDCFYGIPDPRKAQQLISRLMVRPATREEEQVVLLEKIYDKI
jgi:membrane protein YdbS with pleckstrin-like domain